MPTFRRKRGLCAPTASTDPAADAERIVSYVVEERAIKHYEPPAGMHGTPTMRSNRRTRPVAMPARSSEKISVVARRSQPLPALGCTQGRGKHLASASRLPAAAVPAVGRLVPLGRTDVEADAYRSQCVERRPDPHAGSRQAPLVSVAVVLVAVVLVPTGRRCSRPRSDSRQRGAGRRLAVQHGGPRGHPGRHRPEQHGCRRF